MKNVRLVDLSYTLHPGAEQRKFKTTRVNSNQVANVPYLPGQWYIMHEIELVSHLGTHIEAPFHIREEGEDTASIPLDKLVGEAVVLDLRGLPVGAEIDVARLKEAADGAGGLRRGDLVILQTGWDAHWGTPEYENAPYLAPAAARWLVDAGAGLIGIDTGGAEVPGSEHHVNHHIMLDAGVPHIENLRNLAALRKSRVFLFAAPVAAVGLESFPMRVIAVESDD